MKYPHDDAIVIIYDEGCPFAEQFEREVNCNGY